MCSLAEPLAAQYLLGQPLDLGCVQLKSSNAKSCWRARTALCVKARIMSPFLAIANSTVNYAFTKRPVLSYKDSALTTVVTKAANVTDPLLNNATARLSRKVPLSSGALVSHTFSMSGRSTPGLGWSASLGQAPPWGRRGAGCVHRFRSWGVADFSIGCIWPCTALEIHWSVKSRQLGMMFGESDTVKCPAAAIRKGALCNCRVEKKKCLNYRRTRLVHNINITS